MENSNVVAHNTYDNKITQEVHQLIAQGKSFDEILNIYAKTPEKKHEIFYYKTKIEADLKAGKPLQEVLSTYIKNDSVVGDIVQRVKVNEAVAGKS